MREGGGGNPAMFTQTSSMSRPPPHANPAQYSDPGVASSSSSVELQEEHSNSSIRNSMSSFSSNNPFIMSDGSNGGAGDASPCNMSPWHHSAGSPYAGSPWNQTGSNVGNSGPLLPTCLLGSLVREEGHIYSLAATGELLYTGSDSKNIRVWKNQKEFCGFKCSSGLVKAIIIAGGKIFSGHQDGKIRVWKVSPKDPTIHKRVGSLPRLKDYIKCSLKPSNYVEGRKNRSALWIRHYDAISCLSFNEEQGLLYSGSWDKTFKVWRVADSKCLESVVAHDDAVNSVVAAGFDGLVFTGSADGTVKVWKRELQMKVTKHVAVQTLLKQESAVTALAVSPAAAVLYSGSSDGLINFWEWERRHLSHGGVLRGHKLAVLCLAAAGSLVLSGSADKTICVWRREGSMHTCLSVLSGHGGPVKCLAIVEDVDRTSAAGGGGARYIVHSGSLDKSVKVWRVSDQPPEALLQGPQYVPDI